VGSETVFPKGMFVQHSRSRGEKTIRGGAAMGTLHSRCLERSRCATFGGTKEKQRIERRSSQRPRGGWMTHSHGRTGEKKTGNGRRGPSHQGQITPGPQKRTTELLGGRGPDKKLALRPKGARQKDLRHRKLLELYPVTTIRCRSKKEEGYT